MADVFLDGRVIIVDDNCLFQNGYHVSVLQEDLVNFFGEIELQISLSAADELTLCWWKASAFGSAPLEVGRLVAANVVRNFSVLDALETSERPVISTIHRHLYTDIKFLTIFCSAHYCRVLGLLNHEHVVFRLCTKVPSIERVVLRAQTVEAFRMASGEFFRAVLRDIIRKQMFLCMEGCNFGICMRPLSSDNQTELWEQLSVISCIPVCQGRLTETSDIVMTCSSQTSDMSISCPKKKSYNNCYLGHCDADVEAVMMSDFAADIADNCRFLTSQKLEICLSKVKEILPNQVTDFTILMDIERVKSLISFKQSQDVTDEFSVAVFSRQCASRLGIMNGNILELSCKSRSHHQQQQHCLLSSISNSLSEIYQHPCRQKVVIAYIDTRHVSGDVIASISSCAWFNLCRMSCMTLCRTCSIRPCYVKVCLLKVFFTLDLVCCIVAWCIRTWYGVCKHSG